MAHRILEQFQHLDRSSAAAEPMSWLEIEEMTRRLAPKTNLVVPKTVLPAAPPYETSGLGRRRGALRQYRCHRGHQNLHIKEFPGHWVVHVDRWNPHLHVVRHLLVDHGFRTFLHIAELLLPSGALAVAGDVWTGVIDAGAPSPSGATP